MAMDPEIPLQQLLFDFLQCGTFYFGIFQGRSGKGKYRAFIHFSVYQYFYRNRRNGNAWSNKEKDKEVNIQRQNTIFMFYGIACNKSCM